MKFLSSILVLATIVISPLWMFSSTYEVVYPQQEENQTDLINIQEEMNLTLGKPIYIEKFSAKIFR